MTAHRRLIPSSPGHVFWPVSGRERVGNEARVSTWLVAGMQNVAPYCLEARNGRLTSTSVIPVTRFNFAGSREGEMKPHASTLQIASLLSSRSNRRALQEAWPNKPCHATRNRFAVAHQPQSLARVRA